MPSFSHGTACAGIRGAKGRQAVCGIAYACTLVSVKVFVEARVSATNPYGFVDGPEIEARVREAALSCDILNLSFGRAGSIIVPADLTFFFPAALEACIAGGRGGKGLILVKSSGNDRQTTRNAGWDPSCNSLFTLVVGALDRFYSWAPSILVSSTSLLEGMTSLAAIHMPEHCSVWTAENTSRQIQLYRHVDRGAAHLRYLGAAPGEEAGVDVARL